MAEHAFGLWRMAGRDLTDPWGSSEELPTTAEPLGVIAVEGCLDGTRVLDPVLNATLRVTALDEGAAKVLEEWSRRLPHHKAIDLGIAKGSLTYSLEGVRIVHLPQQPASLTEKVVGASKKQHVYSLHVEGIYNLPGNGAAEWPAAVRAREGRLEERKKEEFDNRLYAYVAPKKKKGRRGTGSRQH